MNASNSQSEEEEEEKKLAAKIDGIHQTSKGRKLARRVGKKMHKMQKRMSEE